jgi:hypothetical protein
MVLIEDFDRKTSATSFKTILSWEARFARMMVLTPTGNSMAKIHNRKRRMVLSYSRKGYSEAATRQDAETFLRCLQNGLRNLWRFDAFAEPQLDANGGARVARRRTYCFRREFSDRCRGAGPRGPEKFRRRAGAGFYWFGQCGPVGEK